MKNAIIVHGMSSVEEKESPSQKHWLPWLKTQLEKEGYMVYVPEFPVPYLPEYFAWKSVFDETIPLHTGI